MIVIVILMHPGVQRPGRIPILQGRSERACRPDPTACRRSINCCQRAMLISEVVSVIHLLYIYIYTYIFVCSCRYVSEDRFYTPPPPPPPGGAWFIKAFVSILVQSQSRNHFQVLVVVVVYRMYVLKYVVRVSSQTGVCRSPRSDFRISNLSSPLSCKRSRIWRASQL